VVIGGNRVEDEIEAALLFLHLVGIAGHDDFVGAQPQRVLLFVRRGGKHDTCAPNASANFTAIWPNPPRPTTPTFFPLPTPQWRMGEYVVIPAQSSGAVPARFKFVGTRSTKSSSTTMLSE